MAKNVVLYLPSRDPNETSGAFSGGVPSLGNLRYFKILLKAISQTQIQGQQRAKEATHARIQ